MGTYGRDAVDFDYLEQFVGGDVAIADEVLALFQQQAEMWSPMLDDGVPGWRETVHAIKGAAGGIGARDLAEVCASAERADPALAGPALNRVLGALNQALAAIAGRRHRYALAALRA